MRAARYCRQKKQMTDRECDGERIAFDYVTEMLVDYGIQFHKRTNTAGGANQTVKIEANQVFYYCIAIQRTSYERERDTHGERQGLQSVP